jgi:peptide/nickel transport system substrate-binding protein
MKWHRSGYLLFLTLLFCSMLGAEEAVIYLRLADSLTLDPGKFEDFYSQEVIANVFEGLVRLHPGTLAVEPCLAERWVARENGRRWLFQLRRGVTFHDGEEFNARSVVYSFKKRMENRGGEYGAFARVFPFVADVRAEGDWSVEIALTRPYASFLLSLVDFRATIVASGSSDGPEFKPIGTGPYALSEWSRGRPLVLRRYPFYWDGPARIDRVVFKSEKAATLRISQIKNGSAQVAMIRSAAEQGELFGRTDIGLISQPSLSTGYLGFNCFRFPCKRLQVRQAFAHLLNKTVLVRRVFQKLAEPADSFLPTQMGRFASGADRYDFSPQKARELLRQAGLAKGFACTLYYSEGQFGIEEIAKAFTAKARLINVTVRCIQLPFDRFFQAVQDGEPDMFLMSWGYTVDPVVFLNPMFMLVPGSGKMMAVGPEYARILSAAESAIDDRKREDCYAQAQRLLHRELPLIPLFRLNELMAYSTKITRLRMDPLGFLIFRDARLGPK